MYKYCSYITLKNGKRIYARNYGKKAFRFWVNEPEDKIKKTQRNQYFR